MQLRQRLEDAIARGVLGPEAPLPSERELAALTGLSRVTVRKAIQALVDRGVVTQRQGSGSFVSAAPMPAVEQPLSRLTSFTEDMSRRGYAVTAQWLDRGLYLPAPEEMVALALGAGDEVARLGRLRCADGRPMAVERAAVPAQILPDPGVVSRSLYATLDGTGHRPVRALQKLRAVTVDGVEADLMEMPLGAAGLRIERTSYLGDGRPVEFTRSLYRGDAYDFVAELRLSP